MTNHLLSFEGIAALPLDFAVTARTPPSDAWEKCLSTVLGFHELQNDWDGLKAEAPSGGVVGGAIELAENLRRQGKQVPARVIPGVVGTVLFEWQSDGLFVEMEVTSESSAEVLVMRDGQPPWNGDLRW